MSNSKKASFGAPLNWLQAICTRVKYRIISTFSALRDWLRTHFLLRHLIVTSIISLAVFLAIQVTRDTLFFGDSETYSLDFHMDLQRDRSGSDAIAPFVFLNIDDLTYDELGRPASIPRKMIKSMIEAAIFWGARLVMVDFDLSRPDSSWRDEREFQNFLRDIGRDVDVAASGDTVRRIPILFANTTRRARDADPQDVPSIIPSPYDDIIDELPWLHWVSVATLLDEDGITRRIRHWEPACNNGTAHILPGAHILAAAVLSSSESPIDAVRRLHSELAPVLPICEDLNASASEARDGNIAKEEREVLVTIGDSKYRLTETGIDTRINFQMSWSGLDERAPPTILYQDTDNGESEAPALLDLSALGLVQDSQPIFDLDFKDRIFVLGQYHYDSRDVFITPVGLAPMPGAVLLANAIRSFAESGPISGLALWQKIGLLLSLNLMAFGFFTLSRRLSFYNPIFFKQAYLVINVTIWGVISYVLLSQGTWVDFLFPQYVVGIYYVNEDIKELKKGIPWRRDGGSKL